MVHVEGEFGARKIDLLCGLNAFFNFRLLDFATWKSRQVGGTYLV